MQIPNCFRSLYEYRIRFRQAKNYWIRPNSLNKNAVCTRSLDSFHMVSICIKLFLCTACQRSLNFFLYTACPWCLDPFHIVTHMKPKITGSDHWQNAVGPRRSLDPFHVVSNNIKWGKTSWTYRTIAIIRGIFVHHYHNLTKYISYCMTKKYWPILI